MAPAATWSLATLPGAAPRAVVGAVAHTAAGGGRLVPLRRTSSLMPSVALAAMPTLAHGRRVLAELAGGTAAGSAAPVATFARCVEDLGQLAAEVLAIATDHGAPWRFAAATEAAAAAQCERRQLPAADLTDLPFVTLDPSNTFMRDQAFHLRRSPTGFTLRYAVTDAAGLVPPGGALDLEARQRGGSVYLLGCGLPNDLQILPMLPPQLTATCGSLDPDAERGAWVATLSLDAAGEPIGRHLERARIRSRAALTYGYCRTREDLKWDAVGFFDQGRSGHLIGRDYSASLGLLEDVGPLLVARAVRRGACYETAPQPPPRTLHDEDHLGAEPREAPHAPVAQWNAHLSILVNEQVAALLAAAGLRAPYLASPPAAAAAAAALRPQLEALGPRWSVPLPLAGYLGGLPHDETGERARALACGGLPAAIYTPAPGPHGRHGLAAYIHFTSPMRNYAAVKAQEILLAHLAGEPVPHQASAAMAALCADLNAGRLRRDGIDVEVRPLRDAARAAAAAARAAAQALDLRAPEIGRSTDGADPTTSPAPLRASRRIRSAA